MLTAIWTFLRGAVSDIWSQLMGVFSTMIVSLGEDEARILHDAIDKLSQDIESGRSFDEAMAEALTLFFNEEKGEVNKVLLALFNAFAASAEQAFAKAGQPTAQSA